MYKNKNKIQLSISFQFTFKFRNSNTWTYNFFSIEDEEKLQCRYLNLNECVLRRHESSFLSFIVDIDDCRFRHAYAYISFHSFISIVIYSIAIRLDYRNEISWASHFHLQNLFLQMRRIWQKRERKVKKKKIITATEIWAFFEMTT